MNPHSHKFFFSLIFFSLCSVLFYVTWLLAIIYFSYIYIYVVFTTFKILALTDVNSVQKNVSWCVLVLFLIAVFTYETRKRICLYTFDTLIIKPLICLIDKPFITNIATNHRSITTWFSILSRLCYHLILLFFWQLWSFDIFWHLKHLLWFCYECVCINI